MSDLDPVDRRILALLQANARISNADIAREVEMAPSAVLERIRKLEERGVLVGYEARIEPKSVDLGLLAFMFIRANEPAGSSLTGIALKKVPEVQEIHHILGDDCYCVKLRVRDTADLSRLMKERFASIKTIASTRTTIVLETLKESAQLSLHRLDRDEPPAAPSKRGKRA